MNDLHVHRFAESARHLNAIVQAPAADVLKALQEARAIITDGWSEPFTVDASGIMVDLYDEAASRWCVFDALGYGRHGFEAFTVAWAELSFIADPTQATTLHDWLAKSGRKHGEVLTLFDLAISRAKVVARQEAKNEAA